jgi:penicillin-binding protein 1B
MEFMYEKNEILEIYLNDIYLGQKGSIAINGVGEASFFYFGKPINEVSLAEAAAIAGLVKAPNHYSPFIDKFRCRQRRNIVLHAMHAKHWISDKDLQANLLLPVETVELADYSQKAPYFMDYLSRQLETLYSAKTLSSHGLAVYTTLDTQVQVAAEMALKNGLARLERTHPDLKRKDTLQQLQGAIIVMQPKTGYVLAMVGGRDYNASQYNRIVQSQRQPGSAFKPFVYLSGLDKLTLASKLSNEPRTYIVNGKPWQPQNFSQHDKPSVRMRTALAESHNLATVDLAMQVGLESIAKQAARFHFSTTIKPYPSLALGAFEVIPMELARAYCVFAADGVLPYPLSLKDVVDEKGNVLKQTHINIERLISPAKSFIMTSMLQSVVTEGTAISLREKFIPKTIAGKTGTTNNYRDAWFVGYTPDILALVWVGFDNGDSIKATGSTAALPIWAELMSSIPQYLSQNGFNIPPGVVTRVVCSQSGLLAVEKSCPKPIEEYFLEQHVPGQNCPLHPKQGPLKRLNEILDGIKDFFKRN